MKILDFGLAKPARFSAKSSEIHTQTSAGIIMGTVGYMSPEQAGSKQVDFTSDQFSFGLILYEMVTGMRGFAHATTAETLAAIINEEPQPVSSLRPDAPPAVRWIIDRCLAKASGDRYASTSDLARDLQQLEDHYSEIVTVASGLVAQPQKTRATAWFLAGLSAGILAFASDRDGRRQIWLKQVAGRGEITLTSGPDDYPRFSPDGSTVLFIRKEERWSSLYRVSVLGGEPRKLIEDANSADWSPDGEKVAFIHVNNKKGEIGSSIGIANQDGTGAREIAYFEHLQLQHPRWSPDGKWIVARSIPFGQITTPLFLVSTDGKEKREISPPRRMGWFSAAAWSSNRTLVFSEPHSIVAARSSTSGRLIEQDIHSGRIKTLFWSLTLGNTLDILSKGRLVMDAMTSRENLHEVSLSSNGPAQSKWLTRGISSDRQPTYSPDGEWILFSSNRSGNLDLWAVSSKTGVSKRITDDAAEDWDPAYTRDGKILWSTSRGGHFEIWTAQPDGSNPRQVTSDGADAENPTATPDGKWIVYASYNPEKLGLWKVRSDGSETTQIISGDSDLPETSPDGQYVLYRDARADPYAYIRVVRLADSAILPFLVQVRYTSRHEDLMTGSGGRSRWMPDGRSIAFLDLHENGVQGIFLQDFDPLRDTSASRRPLTGFDFEAPTESFGISPDGSRITIAGLEASSSLMIAENVAGISPPMLP